MDAQVLQYVLARRRTSLPVLQGAHVFRDDEGKSHQETTSSEKAIQFTRYKKLTGGVPA